MSESDRITHQPHLTGPQPGTRTSFGWRFLPARVLTLALAATLATGCAGGKMFGGSSGAGSKSGAQTFYAGVERLKVYKEAGASSKVLGELSLHQKVTRSKIESGYAYIKTDNGKLQGWVLNARLLWRLPATTAAPGAAPAEEPAAAQPETAGAEASAATPVADEPPAPPQAQEPAAAEPHAPSPTPAKPASARKSPPVDKPSKGVTPSIFDPY